MRGRRTVWGGRAKVRASPLHGRPRRQPGTTRFSSASTERLVELGKPKKLALTAVMRKLLTILNAILRDQKPWQNA